MPTVWPSTLVQRLQGIWDGPTVWPSILAPNCKVSGMNPPCGHPPLLDIFAKDLVRTHRMAVHPSALLARSLGCAHRMAIHPCSQVARYLGWAHRMAIHPCFILQGVWDEPIVWPFPLVPSFLISHSIAKTFSHGLVGGKKRNAQGLSQNGTCM